MLNYLTRIAARLKSWLPYLAIAAAGLAATTSFYSFFGFRDSALFRDQLIAKKYEGSLSEDLGFEVALTAEIAGGFDSASDEEKRIAEAIGAYLRAAKAAVEGIEPLPPQEAIEFDSLEALDRTEELVSLLRDPILPLLSLAELGLEANHDKRLAPLACVQSALSLEKADSFVFVPAPLVESDGTTADLPLSVRREVVRTKLLEPYLLEVGALFAKDGVHQSYFIPYSGIIRVRHEGDQEPQYSHYGESFGRYPVRSFSDRTYFMATFEKEDHYRVSDVYLDVAGGGLVRTYSVFLSNPGIGLVGMLGVDRRLSEGFARSWSELNLGAGLGLLRDFEYGVYRTGDSDEPSQVRSAPTVPGAVRDRIRTEIDKQPQDFQKSPKRISGDGYTVFTAPKGGKEIAFYVFDSGRTKTKYFLLSALLAVSGAALATMLLITLVARREAEQRLQQVHQQGQLKSEIVGNLNGGFVTVGDDDRVVDSNKKFKQLISAPEGARLTALFSDETKNEYLDLKRTKGAFEFAGQVRGADKKLAPYIISSAPLLFEETHANRMLLLIPSNELELTIAKKFLHIFSHALKTPVHNILLIADNFRRKKAFPRFAHFWRLMQSKVAEFSILVDDVLRFSELDIRKEKPKLTWINAAQILRDALSPTIERAKAEGLHLSYHVPESLRARADPEMLRIVFNNLLDNALKYTDEGEIRVHASRLGSIIRVEVTDTGPGVPEGEEDRIFELFYQARRTTGSRRGLGLGLYLSRQYIDLHDGTLAFEHANHKLSANGKGGRGATFIVTLPVESE